MRTKKLSANALLKLNLTAVVGQKKSTPLSKEAVTQIISLCGGIVPIPVIVNQCNGNIISGQDFYRVLQTMTKNELKNIKEIPVIFIDIPDSQTELALVTTIPDVNPHWRINDYIELFAANNNGDYKKLLALCNSKQRVFKNSNNNTPRGLVAAMALRPGRPMNEVRDELKSGNFTIKPKEITAAKKTASEVFQLSSALKLRSSGDFTSGNVTVMIKELQKASSYKSGHTNKDRIAEFKNSSQVVKSLCRRGWKPSGWREAFDLIESRLP